MSARATTDPSARRAPTLALALIVAAVFAAYWPSWQAGFIWDDDLHVSANPHMLSARGLIAFWTTPAANYCPLTMTTFWGLHALFGLNPLPFHVANVALHALAAVLLWRVLLRLRVPGAALGAGLWALHPVQVESVAWISELKNTQSAVFFLLSILFYLRRSETSAPSQARWNYGWALACAALAMLSKSSTVMLPAVLVLCAWWRQRRLSRHEAWSLIPFFVLSAAASAWTIWEQKYSSLAQGPDWELSLGARLAGAGHVFWFYLGKLAWPDPLSFIYPRWTLDAASIGAWLPALAAFALLAAGLAWQRRSPAARGALFCAACFAALLFPVLGFFDVYFFRFSYVGDHLQYLASMVPLALFGAIIARAGPRHATLAGAVLAGALALSSRAHVPQYRSNLTLFSATVAKNPAAWMAHNNLAAALLEGGELDAALRHAREALALRRDFADGEITLGRILIRAGQPAEALAAFQRAVAFAPDDLEARNNLGIAFAALRRTAEALNAFDEVLRREPGHPGARLNRGLALALAGDFSGAQRAFEQLLAQNPNHAEAEMNLGLALAAQGRAVDGLPHLAHATLLAPRDARIQAGYGRALIAAGRLPDAAEKFTAALRLDPRNAEARALLVQLLRELGRTAEADQVAAGAK